ncbi:hypothetical protein GCM10025857_31930 [Alicyclobacillus contaminans]|uniref:hypothetical protein n=1 Tax=Alicyclobacillus contaminans TaxID=392016 RepID=UPI0003F838F4|nr:hypothetical protein [Alicyclobacillus contaminans]GMA51836.1 hypothetical protein GCM10025857_31930 [Alicyclobacillus contaminans]
MYDEVRGMHTCFVCRRAMTWVAHLYGGNIIAHGAEIVGGVTVTGERAQDNTVPLEVKLVCPACGANNSFPHTHTVQ